MARGGYRPGAGRPKGANGKPSASKAVADAAATEGLTPLDYMLKVMRDDEADDARKDRMAIAAAPFVHARKGEGQGKKDEKAEKAKKAGSGKFAPSAAPQIARVK